MFTLVLRIIRAFYDFTILMKEVLMKALNEKVNSSMALLLDCARLNSVIEV